jgi:hypothetical protein
VTLPAHEILATRMPKENASRQPQPIGAVVLRGKGKSKARYVKVTHHGPMIKRWKCLARIWWEANKGPVPAGMRVVHLDGDTLNDTPTNYGLMHAGEIIRLYHRIRPKMAARNRQSVGAAMARFNRDRAALRRERSLLPRRWYLVDPEKRIIFNHPRRMRWQAYQLAGVDVDASNWRFLRRILAANPTPLRAMKGRTLQADAFQHFTRTTKPPTISAAIAAAVS